MVVALNQSEVINNTAEYLIDSIVPAVMDRFSPLLTILKAVGIIFIFYIIYMIARGVIRWKDHKRIKKIEEKVDLIYNKIIKKEKNK